MIKPKRPVGRPKKTPAPIDNQPAPVTTDQPAPVTTDQPAPVTTDQPAALAGSTADIAADTAKALGTDQQQTQQKVSDITQQAQADQPRTDIFAASGLNETDIADFAKMAFALIATRAGEHWTLTDNEAALLAKYFIKLAQQKQFTWLDKAPATMFIGAMAFAVLSRLALSIKLKKQATQ